MNRVDVLSILMSFLENSNLSRVLMLTHVHHECMMKSPQAGRAVAAPLWRGRGKSALHRARRRITSGAGIKPAGTGPQKQTASPHLCALSHWERGGVRNGDGEKVV